MHTRLVFVVSFSKIESEKSVDRRDAALLSPPADWTSAPSTSAWNRLLLSRRLSTSSSKCYLLPKGGKKSKSSSSDSGEENLSKKDLALKLAMDQIQASFGKESQM